MSGNVWEWVWDWWSKYSSIPQSDPVGPSSGADRINRGGSWYRSALRTRVAYRDCDSPSMRANYLGFRLSRSASAQ